MPDFSVNCQLNLVKVAEPNTLPFMKISLLAAELAEGRAQLARGSEDEDRCEFCNAQLHGSRSTNTKAALAVGAASNPHLGHWNACCGHHLQT